TFPNRLFERVGSGLFLRGGKGWLGQFDAGSTTMTPVPSWLEMRPFTTLHMVHGGRGYAVMPFDLQDSASCEQTIEVFSPSGQSCGSATFTVGGGGCRTGGITVGYDGTVVQQLPRERES